MHTHACACMSVCVLSQHALLQPGRGVERVWLCLAVDMKLLQRDPGGRRVQASPRTRRPSQRMPGPAVPSLTPVRGMLSGRAALGCHAGPRRVSGLLVPGEGQRRRGSVFFKSLFAASEIPSPSWANRSICAFRSLKIHSTLTAPGMACVALPAAEGRRRGREPSCPGGEGLGRMLLPRDVRGPCPSGLVARAWSCRRRARRGLAVLCPVPAAGLVEPLPPLIVGAQQQRWGARGLLQWPAKVVRDLLPPSAGRGRGEPGLG